MVFFACVSCKEYLDVKPKGEVIPKTAEEFAALLNSHLSEIDDGYDEAILGNAMEKLELELFINIWVTALIHLSLNMISCMHE